MENCIPETRVAGGARKTWRPVLAAVLLLLAACDRPGLPPSPVDPVKPKMISGRLLVDVHQAIFNYARPPGKASSSLQPVPEEGRGGRLQV